MFIEYHVERWCFLYCHCLQHYCIKSIYWPCQSGWCGYQKCLQPYIFARVYVSTRMKIFWKLETYAEEDNCVPAPLVKRRMCEKRQFCSLSVQTTSLSGVCVISFRWNLFLCLYMKFWALSDTEFIREVCTSENIFNFCTYSVEVRVCLFG